MLFCFYHKNPNTNVLNLNDSVLKPNDSVLKPNDSILKPNDSILNLNDSVLNLNDSIPNLATFYRYDQLNRIVQQHATDAYDYGNNKWIEPTAGGFGADSDYFMQFAYDPKTSK